VNQPDSGSPVGLRCLEVTAQTGDVRLEDGLGVVQLGVEPVRLRFDRPEPEALERARPMLRLVNARDCRCAARIEVRWRDSIVGVVDVRIAARWANFALDLSNTFGLQVRDWPELIELELRVSAANGANDVGLRDSVRQDDALPALIVSSHQFTPVSAFLIVPDGVGVSPEDRAVRDFLCSSMAVDHLGWMTGCVTTGLADLFDATGDGTFLEAAARVLSAPGEGRPLELPDSLPILNTPDESNTDEGNISNLESFAPFAALARLQLENPTPQRALRLRAAASRMLQIAARELPQLTTEGCFTLAFPLAAIARALNEPAWFDTSTHAVLERWRVLEREVNVAQRGTRDGTRRWMENWARGTAWLVLGTAQTLRELPEHHPVRAELIHALERIAPVLLERQRPDGLWNVFTDSATGFETSGSAGIAAGLSIAVRAGWFGPDLSARILDSSRRCLHALETHLDPDGCLNGVSQHNPVAERALQLDYRIRAAWGTGLYAQLLAALMPDLTG
jgi:rhamnogalacturonyl hydrolase YesR